MRPDEEMIAGVEEVELEPCDLFTLLGTLIIEGRVPGLSDRGYGEGPHCSSLNGQNRHVCDSSSVECQHHEQLEKHMLLLWKNGIPLSVEVLLYPACCQSPQVSGSNLVETSSAPQTGPCVLLEQWTLHMLHRRLADATIPPRGLIQAVRSFLHFSQLSAWLSLSKGRSNLNIHYRLCVPGEAFSSKFDQDPNYHSFPVANVGRSAMKITVRSLPRCGTIPQVPCLKHDMSAISTALQQMPSVFLSASCGLETQSNLLTDRLCNTTKDVLHSACSTTSDSALGMGKPTMQPSLGDSLLDPPQSLQMYPKRYQSPSRCGSPSMEAPEHLMFRPGTSTKREPEPRSQLGTSTRNRSRPQRRPVVERFLKKEFGAVKANSSLLPCGNFKTREKQNSFLEEKTANELKNKNPAFKMQLPDSEIQMVLNQLRHRHTSMSKTITGESNDAKDCYFLKEELYKADLPKEMKENQVLNHSLSKSKVTCLNHHSEYPSKNEDTQFSTKPFHKQFANLQNQSLSTLPSLSSQFSSEFFQNHSAPSHFQPTRSSTPVSESQSSESYSSLSTLSADSSDQNEDGLLSILDKKNHRSSALDYLDLQDDSACEEEDVCDHSNLFFIDGILPEHRTKGEESIENHNLSLGQFSQLEEGETIDSSSQILHDSENSNSKNVNVPSSADKLKFRRSLDSATSMVFHQNTGLPLTSSPAPIRKSGTCFDFDSSLTSVSAIKRALFEKDPESDASESQRPVLSTSAPSSTTTNNLLGNFEESVLNGRLEPVSTVEEFTAEIGASGSFCPRHKTLPVTVFFYTLHDVHKVTSPYLGHINLGRKGYYVPKKGTIQVTLFNPHRTVVKMFVVRYDLSDMPPSCQTFLRQRTLYMPTGAHEDDVDARKWLRYLIHLRFASSKSGKIYLHTDVRMIVFRKSDLDAATIHGQRPYELRSFTQEPLNPKFSPYK